MTSNSIYGSSENPRDLYGHGPWHVKPETVKATSPQSIVGTVVGRNVLRKTEPINKAEKTGASLGRTIYTNTTHMNATIKNSIKGENGKVGANYETPEDLGLTSTQEELDRWSIEEDKGLSLDSKKGEKKIFSPVDGVWQGRTAQHHNLNVVKYLKYGSESVFFQTSPPSLTVSVAGDGNCFFRAMSVIVTGSETSHMALREAVLKHVSKHPECYRSFLSSRGGMRSYLTDMRQSGEWATDREILATATMLKVVIEVYSKKYGWQSFKPLDDPELRGPSVYISNIGYHFEPVTAI